MGELLCWSGRLVVGVGMKRILYGVEGEWSVSVCLNGIAYPYA